MPILAIIVLKIWPKMRLEVLIRDVLIKKVCKQQKDQMARAAGCQDSILQT